MPQADRTISLEDWKSSLENFRSEEAEGSSSTPAVSLPLRRDLPRKPVAFVSERKRAFDSAGVSLADLAASGVRIESHEAVAIVQALCQGLIDSDEGVGRSSLDLDQVFIKPSGDVRPSPGDGHDSPAAIHGLGRLLSDILPANDFMFLRARVVEKATSSPPAYASLEEFAQ